MDQWKRGIQAPVNAGDRNDMDDMDVADALEVLAAVAALERKQGAALVNAVHDYAVARIVAVRVRGGGARTGDGGLRCGARGAAKRSAAPGGVGGRARGVVVKLLAKLFRA